MFAPIVIYLILTCLCRCSSISPNLISNGSFDNVTRCPKRISEIRLAEGWSSSGSSDLFCTCSPTQSAVYSGLNFAGTMTPNSGPCFAGFIVNNRYKEYPTFELPKKMRRNSTYCIRFLYSRSEFSGVKVKRLGIYVYKDPLRNSQRGQPLKIKTADAQIADLPGMWTAVSFTFNCKGGERYFSIGSFNDDLEKAVCLPATKNLKVNRVFNYTSSAYYFIEDLQLTQLRRGEICREEPLPQDTIYFLPLTIPSIVQADTLSASTPFILNDLHFETNKSEILSVSFEELDELANYLAMQPELKLTIVGHTDNVGLAKKNIELSEARARAVAEHLVKRGVHVARLYCAGFGARQPVADNETEEGREKNRRVEFQFLNK
jgi:OOP family OmpA-OmpF porin